MKHRPPPSGSPRNRGWLSFYIPCGPNTWRKALREVRSASHEAIDLGLATQWFYVFLDEGQGLRLRWRIQVPPAARPDFLRVAPRRLTRSSVAYVPEFRRYGGRRSMAVCETLFWRSSEVASEVLGIRRWDYGSRLVLAAVLQRQLVRELANGLSLRQPAILSSIRDGWIRNEARDDVGRVGELTEKIGAIAGTAVDFNQLKGFEKTLRKGLTSPRGIYAAEVRKLSSIRRSGPIQWPRDARRNKLWSESLARSLIHMMNNRLRLRNLDEALVAEVVLRSIQKPRARRTPRK